MPLSRLLRRQEELGDEGERGLRSFTTTLTLLVVSLLIACATQMGGNVELERRSGAYAAIWPQGWIFFTGLGAKDVLVAYRTDVSGDQLLPESQHEDWSDRAWGMERASEPATWEISDLARQVPQEDWRPCAAATAADCRFLLAGPASHTLTNWSSSPTLCGLTVITIEHPNSPVGATLPPSPRHVSAVAKVNLTCPP
jgi:hypothetical protein